MTVIAWDGKTLAADRRMCSNGTIKETRKIELVVHRTQEFLCGMAGDYAYGQSILYWFKHSEAPADFPKPPTPDSWACLITINPFGGVEIYEQTPHPFQDLTRMSAWGTGKEAAMAAMLCGKTAKEAVEIACLIDNGCGNGVDVLTLD